MLPVVKPPLTILLLSDDADRVRRWAIALAAAGARVHTSVGEVPNRALVDVIVTDRPADVATHAIAAARLAIAAAELARASPDLPRRTPGIVCVGASGGDVDVPHDVSDRELLNSCGLLCQSVRLRRRLHRSEIMRRALSRRAASDPLSGLPNRLAWQKELNRRLASARASHQSLTLALVDLDHFREINAQQGYAAGDEALRHAAGALRGALRDGDFVARWGGDEFALLVSGLDAESAQRLIETARAAIAQAPSLRPDQPRTASAGVATSRQGQLDAESLLAAADEALRRAKATGRNRTIGAPPMGRT